MSITIVMPSRGRPARARAAVQAIRDTAVLVSTSVVLAVDADDPELEAYQKLRWPGDYRAEVSLVELAPEDTGNLVRATNTVSLRIAGEDPTAIIGNLGDDHVCRTPGWDRLVADALADPGIAYGDDLYQHDDLPTAPFISAEIVLALGWYALPDLEHLWIDNVWRDVGAQTGRLRYLPNVVIEHMHPLAGKGFWDPGYERVNNDAAIRRDGEAYGRWREVQMASDIEQVRRALAVAA